MGIFPSIEVTAVCHRGLVRPNNEDSITVAGWVCDVEMTAPRRSRHELKEPLLFAVADGMGGHAGGEVASQVAVDVLRTAFIAHNGSPLSSHDLLEATPGAKSQAGTRSSAWRRSSAVKKRILPDCWLKLTPSFMQPCAPIIRCSAWEPRS